MSVDNPDKPPTTLPGTSRSLPISLAKAREKVMAPIRTMLADAGISEQQWRILRVLAEFGPLDGTTLADRASLLLPSQTRIVQAMVEKGYVTRTTDPNDRRRQTVAIAPKGQAIIDDHLDEATRIVALFKQALGEAEYETLLDLLERVDQRL